MNMEWVKYVLISLAILIGISFCGTLLTTLESIDESCKAMNKAIQRMLEVKEREEADSITLSQVYRKANRHPMNCQCSICLGKR